MNRSVKLISLIIITIGFSVFGLLKEKKDVKVCNDELRTGVFLPINPASAYLNFRFYGTKKLSVEVDLMYKVSGRYDHSITLEKMKNAILISDIIEDYPSNWIDDYVSVGISIIGDESNIQATSKNDTLSKEQKIMFNAVEMASDVIINVIYKTKNAATDHMDNRQMNVSMTVVPEREAAYVGGNKKMIQFLKESSADYISDEDLIKFQMASIVFTVNEAGEIAKVLLDKSSGNIEIDKLFVDLINKMPKWNPAENADGTKIKQEFVFSVGRMGC